MSGKFYNVYDNDAIIISYLFDYKIYSENKCGFPEIAFEKVITKLENLNISYQIIKTNKDNVIKDYRKLNKYDEYLEKAISKLDITKRIDLIIEKIKACDSAKLDEIIERLEECIK